MLFTDPPVFAPLAGDPDFILAALRLLHGDAEGAIEAIQQNQPSDTWGARKQILEALAHLNELRLESAARSAREAIALDPDSWIAGTILVASLRLGQKLPDAIEACRQCLHLFPLEGVGEFLLGFLLEQDGQFLHAIEAYTASVRENPMLDKAYFRLAVVCMRAGRPEASAVAVKNGLRLNSAVPHRLALAKIYTNEENFEAARKELEYAREIIAQPAILCRLASVYHALGRIDDSTKLHEEVAEMAPRNWENMFALGRVYAEQKRFADAIVAFQKTLEVVPFHLDAYLCLVESFLAEGKTTEARETLETVIDGFPGHNAHARERLAALPPRDPGRDE